MPENPPIEITPELLLNAYARGYFPMAENRDSDELHWYYPEHRGILPLENFHTPKSLIKALKKTPFRLTLNQAFPDVIRACAEARPERPESWINPKIIRLYTQLWEHGYAHSVECWKNDVLAGGLYGVSLGGAFFGESMFSHETNASKAALLHLISMLKAAGYTLLDTQYVNNHLKQFGVREIPRRQYLRLLEKALEVSPLSLSAVQAV